MIFFQTLRHNQDDPRVPFLQSDNPAYMPCASIMARIQSSLGRAIALMLTGTAFAVGTVSIAHAQDIEPRAYLNAPMGVNFLIAGYAYTQGAVPFGASPPVKNAQLDTSNAVLLCAGIRAVGPVGEIRRHRSLFLVFRNRRGGGRAGASASSMDRPIPDSYHGAQRQDRME